MAPRAVLEDLLPGPVTVVGERSGELNPLLNPGTNLVGIRIPDHTFIRRLAQACDSPLALTSANRSSAQSTLTLDVSDQGMVWRVSQIRTLCAEQVVYLYFWVCLCLCMLVSVQIG